MATSDTEILLDVWNTLKSFIPAKDKMESAERLIKILDDHGIRKTEIFEMVDDDKILQTAFDRYFVNDDTDDEWDDEWDEYDG
ncbi:hypothetical protein N9I00_00920 [bacterium]|nr:hypothetical protein [bacterium]